MYHFRIELGAAPVTRWTTPCGPFIGHLLLSGVRRGACGNTVSVSGKGGMSVDPTGLAREAACRFVTEKKFIYHKSDARLTSPFGKRMQLDSIR